MFSSPRASNVPRAAGVPLGVPTWEVSKKFTPGALLYGPILTLDVLNERRALNADPAVGFLESVNLTFTPSVAFVVGDFRIARQFSIDGITWRTFTYEDAVGGLPSFSVYHILANALCFPSLPRFRWYLRNLSVGKTTFVNGVFGLRATGVY